MKAALVVSRRFFQHEGQWYTIGAAGSETGVHYLDVFDKVILCGRAGVIDAQSLARATPLDPRLEVVLLPNLATPLGHLTQISRVRSILREVFNRVDAVITRLGQHSIHASAVAQAMGKPLACDVGGRKLESLASYGTLASSLYAPLAECNARRVIKRCDYVSFVSQSYLQRHYPVRKDAVTFAGSNVDIPTPQASVLERRLSRIGSPRDEIVFGTVGSLSGKLKGIHLALDALAHCKDTLPAWRYRVLGGGDPGPLQAQARRLGISERVHFDGTLPGGQPVLEWLDQIDVLLHPSMREGVPRAIIEAMSRGCPVIATDVGATAELLEPSDLIPSRSVPAIVAALPGATSTEWQAARARANWTKAHRYDRDTLGKERRAFWEGFARYAQTNRTECR